MSAVQSTPPTWSRPISKEDLDSKYEKCRNITEEIYKRINITFQIKKLETASQSDVSYHSDQIDSNELSNETDLFACDKSDSIPSSTEAEPPSKPATKCDKVVNNNNNEENKKQATLYKRPRKKFRKRVKKRPSLPRSESDGSSDEALPLSRALPAIVILTKDLKPKILSPEKKPAKKSTETAKQKKTATPKSPNRESNKDKIESEVKESTIDTEETLQLPKEKSSKDSKTCGMCNLPFRSERGLRRHLALSHITPDEPISSRLDRREAKPA